MTLIIISVTPVYEDYFISDRTKGRDTVRTQKAMSDAFGGAPGTPPPTGAIASKQKVDINHSAQYESVFKNNLLGNCILGAGTRLSSLTVFDFWRTCACLRNGFVDN